MGLLAIPASVLVALIALGWVCAQVRLQQAGIAGRIDGLVTRVASLPVRSDPADAGRDTLFPIVSLMQLNGHPIVSGALFGVPFPLLFVFVGPECRSCYDLLPDIAAWQTTHGDELAIAVISTGDLDRNRQMIGDSGVQHAFVQRELELVQALDLRQAPAAIVVGRDRRIVAGPRYGVTAIRELTAETLGHPMPVAPVRS